MLNLTDPLWEKLDSAHRDVSIPDALRELGETWDGEKVSALFGGNLCHQGTCYGATYAAIPHLLNIAETASDGHQRSFIVCFAGYVALCALRDGQGDTLPGLPETLGEWDRKLDVYRSLVETMEDPGRQTSDYEQLTLLPQCRAVLALAPVNSDDLEKIRAIKSEFFSDLARISALCERSLLENPDSDNAMYLLSGIAAAEALSMKAREFGTIGGHGAAVDRLTNLARFLEYGKEGGFRCSACDWPYDYHLFGDRVAIYAMPTTKLDYQDRTLQDWEEKAPSRADGFMIALGSADPLAPVLPFGAETTPPQGDEGEGIIAKLLSLSAVTADPDPHLLLRSFLGRVHCRQCGADSTIRPI